MERVDMCASFRLYHRRGHTYGCLANRIAACVRTVTAHWNNGQWYPQIKREEGNRKGKGEKKTVFYHILQSRMHKTKTRFRHIASDLYEWSSARCKFVK